MTAFDAEQVRVLAAILVDTGLTEIEVEGKDGRIRVARSQQSVVTTVAAAAAPVVAVPAAVVADDAVHPGAVLSPMVGVAYLSSEPGAANFVTQGQSVSVGQTLLLIEAMKTYNQIRATKSGIVSRVLVISGEPVEYDQPLLIVE